MVDVFQAVGRVARLETHLDWLLSQLEPHSGVLVAATACVSETRAESTPDLVAETSTPTSASSTTNQDPDTEALSADQANQTGSYSPPETAREESLNLLATDIEAELDCVKDKLSEVATAELERLGIRDTGVARGMWDEVIADVESPVLDPLMLTVSLCTEFFEQLVYEDLSDQLQPDELDCVVQNGRSNPDIVVLHMAGTRNGATVEDTYPEAMVIKLQRGQVARFEIITAMRTLGECPSNNPT